MVSVPKKSKSAEGERSQLVMMTNNWVLEKSVEKMDGSCVLHLRLRTLADVGCPPHAKPGNEIEKAEKASMVFRNWLVVDRIAKFVRSKELLHLRQTCTAWNRSFVPLLKVKHSPIQLKSKSGVGRDGGRVRVSSASVMRNFVQVMQSSYQIPFTRFHIQPGGDEDEGAWRTAFNEFLADFGNSVTFLSMRWWKPYLSPPEFRRLVLEQLPNVTTICFDPCEYTPGQGRQDQRQIHFPLAMPSKIPNLRQVKLISRFSPPTSSMVHLASEMIQSANGLETISVKLGRGYDGHGFTEGILSTLNLPSMKSQVQNLKTLKISIHTGVQLEWLSQIAQLAELGPAMHLNVLSLELVCNIWTPFLDRDDITTLFYEFLLNQAPTLMKLTLEFTRFTGEMVDRPDVSADYMQKYEFPFRVPAMKQLRTLKLVRGEMMQIDLEFEGSNLIETFPHLHRLAYRHQERVCIDQNRRNANLRRDIGRISHAGLKDLSIWATDDNFCHFDLSWFPRVTKLEIKVLPPIVATVNANKTPTDRCRELLERILG